MSDRTHDETESRKTTSLSLSPVILRKKKNKENIKRTIKLKFFLFQSNTKTVVVEIER